MININNFSNRIKNNNLNDKNSLNDDSLNDDSLNDNNLINDKNISLSNFLKNLFLIYEENHIENPIYINYLFNKENYYGNIEYKRSLLSYNNKTNKLLRQILWRISENKSVNLCYIIIGVEDNGSYSNLTSDELNNSLSIIKNTISNTKISIKYRFLINLITKSLILVVYLYIENYNNSNIFF
jgi:cysteinyl-tRNA synthetase